MFLLDMQMGLLKAWTDAAETGLRVCTDTMQRAAGLTPAMPQFSPMPMAWGTGWPLSAWSPLSPFSAMAASPFVAMMPWARFGQSTPASFWGWPIPAAPGPVWPLSAFTAFSPMTQSPWPGMFGGIPSAWAFTPSFWWQDTHPRASQPVHTSYRSAGGHATAAVLTPADLAQSMTDFWTTWGQSTRRTLN